MDRRTFLQGAGASLGYAWAPPLTLPASQLAPRRGCRLYVDPRLQERGYTMAKRLLAAATTSPLLHALSPGSPPVLLREAPALNANSFTELAFNHYIAISLPGDPLLAMAWQQEAVLTTSSLYTFGWGAFQGSLGYIESDRNPFLHSPAIDRAPFETQWISITGTDVDGLSLAVEAFCTQGLVNGVVADHTWKRTEQTLLDQDPLPGLLTLPLPLPATLDGMPRIALTAAGRDEYRGVLEDTGLEPLSLWRAKYYQPGEWDTPGVVASFHNYVVGLHRRAYGNTVWIAEFSDKAAATSAAPAIAKAARLTQDRSRWTGQLPPYAWGLSPQGDAPSTGALVLWVDDRYVLLSARTSSAEPA